MQVRRTKNRPKNGTIPLQSIVSKLFLDQVCYNDVLFETFSMRQQFTIRFSREPGSKNPISGGARGGA